MADIQMMTPHFEALGAKEVPRAEFLRRLKETQAKGLTLFDPPPASPQAATEDGPSSPSAR